jgi:trehalose 6-phosphate phosphatase
VTASDVTERLAEPPLSLLAGASLFLDLDGTLLELIDRPEQVVADEALQALLARLDRTLNGRLAIISGRSIAQLDAILGPIAADLALSGSHGCEHRWRGIAAQPHRPPSLDVAAARLQEAAATQAGMMVEEKSFGVALHYRLAPEAGEQVLALAEALAAELGLMVQPGKMMVELRVPGGDKGVAVRRMMGRPPMAGTRPLFIGDDRTDEHGFQAAAELGGAGILVGEPRETAARFTLADPAAVRDWLARAIA